jgi:hypothetical protein
MSVIEASDSRFGPEGRRRMGLIAGIITGLFFVTTAIVVNVQTDHAITSGVVTNADRIVGLVNRGLVPRATLQPAARIADDLERLKSIVGRGFVPPQTLEP